MFWLAQQPGFQNSRCVSVHTSLGTTFGTSVPASLAQASSDAAPTVSGQARGAVGGKGVRDGGPPALRGCPALAPS
jgi:hypothetical protein